MAGLSKKYVCGFCEKSVSKSAHALKCSRCEAWQHIGCDSLVEEDYVFMKNRSKYGFRCMCSDCLIANTANSVVALSDVSAMISDSLGDMHTKLNERLYALETCFSPSHLLTSKKIP